MKKRNLIPAVIILIMLSLLFLIKEASAIEINPGTKVKLVNLEKMPNGSLIVGNGSTNNLVKLPKGANGTYLSVLNGELAWGAASSSSPGGATTNFQFNDGGSSFGGNGALTFTKATKTLAVASDAPLDINSTTVSIADTNISFDGASTTFTGTGAMTITPGAGTNLNIPLSGAGDLAVNGKTLYVDSSGRSVGIGTTSPDYNLHVYSTGTANTPNFSLENNSTDTSGQYGPYFRIKNGVTGTHGYILTQLQSSAAPLAIVNAESPFQQFITLNQNGNVGIGSISPTATLDVTGTIKASSQVNGKALNFNGNSLSVGSLAQGSLLYAKSTSTVKELAKGTNHYALKVNGNNLAWEAVSAGSSGPVFDYVTGDESFTSTTVSNSTLSIPLSSSKKYEFELNLNITSTPTPGYAVRVTCTNSDNLSGLIQAFHGSAVLDKWQYEYGTADTIDHNDTADSNYSFSMTGTIESGTATALSIQGGIATGSGTAVFKKGSYLRVTEIP